MLNEIMKELHDAKLKSVHAINNGDTDLANKYLKIIKELEESIELLKQLEK